MNAKRITTVSKYLSKYLRHAPEEIGISLEPGGWVEVHSLLAATAKQGFAITSEELQEVVRTSDKKRFSFDESGMKVRANQGHSTEVDLQLTAATPPSILYHGTAVQFRESIFEKGLLKGRRHHVHLSTEIETARRVGIRHGKPLIFVVDAGRMAAEGHPFWISDNGVWLADTVPPQFLSVFKSE